MLSELSLAYILLLPLLGAAVAALGTMIGLGGGFILVPILILLFPEAAPATIIAISLTVVFFNASSATVGNMRAGRIDLRTGAILLIGAVPAAVAGSFTAGVVSREQFESLFGALLLAGAAYILWRSTQVRLIGQPARHEPNRRIQERRGTLYLFYINGLLAVVISPVAGFVSSFFGIGGGIIHVPSLTFMLKMPPRLASPTSLLVLVPTSMTALLTLYFTNAIDEGWRRAALLGAGALIGAQVGVYLNSRVNPRGMLVILSMALFIVGIRQVVAGLE